MPPTRADAEPASPTSVPGQRRTAAHRRTVTVTDVGLREAVGLAEALGWRVLCAVREPSGVRLLLAR